MAFPTATETQTTLASEIPLIWGQRLNDFYKQKLVCADFFVDRSDEVADGARSLYTPTLTEFEANAKSNASTVTLNSPTDTKVTLTISNWYECSFAIEDAEAAQVFASYALMERYAKNCGYEIAKTLDLALAALFSTFTNTPVGQSTVNLADSDIRAAIATLESVNVDIEECAFFVHPNVFWKQIQSIDKFSLAINSPVNDPTAKMPRATLYGIPVYVSNSLQFISGGTTGRYNALAHSDAIHFATAPLGAGGSMGQMVGDGGVRVQANYVPQYLSTVVTADMLYGVTLNRPTAGVTVLSPA
jgi:hypothetical protein